MLKTWKSLRKSPEIRYYVETHTLKTRHNLVRRNGRDLANPKESFKIERSHALGSYYLKPVFTYIIHEQYMQYFHDYDSGRQMTNRLYARVTVIDRSGSKLFMHGLSENDILLCEPWDIN